MVCSLRGCDIVCFNVICQCSAGKFCLCLRVEQTSRHLGPYTDEVGSKFLRNFSSVCTFLSLTYLLTYSLTPWCRVLLEKLTGLQLVKKFPAFYGTRRFITALTSVRHPSLSWASPIQSIYPHPTSWRSILILSTHLRLGLPTALRVLRLRIEELPPIWRVAANKLNKQSWTPNKGWSSSLRVGRGANNPSL